MSQYLDVEICGYYLSLVLYWQKRLDAAFIERPQITPLYLALFLAEPINAEDGRCQAYLLGKFGNAASAVYSRIASAGRLSGIDLI